MNTKHIKITNRPTRKLACILAAFITWILPLLVLTLTIESSRAEDFTWISNNSNLWTVESNWDQHNFPNSSSATAIFDTDFGRQTDVHISGTASHIEVDGIVFNPGASPSPFTITVEIVNSLTIGGKGITNTSGITENFVIQGFQGLLKFTNGTVGNNVTISNEGGPISGAPGGATQFSGSSHAGNAIVIADGGFGPLTGGGSISFQGNSHADNATLQAMGGGGGGNGFGGTISFQGDSTGDTARVEVFGNGSLDISPHSASGVTIGSIEGDGNVSLGTKKLTVGSNNMNTDFSGVIQGGGSLTKVGTGTLTLSGRNTFFTGTTFVNEGTLALVGNGSGPNANQNLVIPGPLIIGDDIGAKNTAKVIETGDVGAVARNAPVTVNSDGLLQVDIKNSFGNGQQIGPLVINRGNVSVTASSSLVFNTLQMIGGSISGGGTIAGPLLTATSDARGNEASISSNVDLGTTSKVFTINDGPGSTDLSISGVIFPDSSATSPVGITKEGTGTLVLSGMNTYTGATTVNGGSLIVDGSIASAQTFVNAGGLLGGGATIVHDLTNSGIVNPGHSPGTLTVAGNYTQTAGGTLQIEIAGTAPGQFDLLRVGGHASLAGTLQLIPLNNFQLQAGDKLTFLTAQGGVSGTFSTIQNPFLSNTLIKAEINVLANAVQLEGTQGSFTTVACNPNTVAVGGALNSAVGDPRMAGVIEFLDTLPLPQICPALELISPEELAAMFNIGVSLANIQTVNLERRMEDIRAGSSGFSARGFSIDRRVPDFSPGLAGPTGPEGKSGPSVMQPIPENRWGIFVTGLGEFTDVDSTSLAPGYDFSTGGLTFGVDYRVSPNFAIGLTGGYAHTNADLVNNGSLDVNGGTIGAYATGFTGGFYVNAAAFGVFNGYDSHRTALLGTASGNTDGQDFNALAMAGYDWKSGGLTIGPLASLQYTYVEFDSFTEHGSLAPLSFSNQNAESTRTALGAKASYDWHVGHILVRPEIRASWQHEFGDTEYSIVSRFASGAGNSFTVNGPAIGRDSLLIGAGAAVLLNDRVSVYAYYDGELARTNYSSNNVSAGVRITF